MSGRGILFTLLGVALIGVGVVLLVLILKKQRRMRSAPVIWSSMGGFSEQRADIAEYDRRFHLRSLGPLPGGDARRRDGAPRCNADERRLPKRIPGKATILLDPETGDAELYCALPFRAMMRPGTAPTPAPAPTPAYQPPVAPTPTPADPLAGIPIVTPQPTAAVRWGQSAPSGHHLAGAAEPESDAGAIRAEARDAEDSGTGAQHGSRLRRQAALGVRRR
jgi:hypothetical protein